MQSTDLKELADRLTQLADALGGKSPSAGAMKVWFDTLSECSFSEVLNVLTDWPKTHAKAPVPAEVLKACRERISDRLERESREQARSAPRFDISKIAAGASTDIAMAELAKINAILGMERPNKRYWATLLRDKRDRGERLSIAQDTALRDYVKAGHEFVDRHGRPIAADGEADAERAAIQAEGA